MSALSLAATQMVRIWELLVNIERAAYLIHVTAADSTLLFRFDPRYFKGGLAC